jgi:dTDP-4-dehydrorhamnose 3,5-epimerase
MAVEIVRSEIDGVCLVKPRVFDDDRGFFLETFRDESYLELTGGRPFVQDNHSRSTRDVLRGLHYQLKHPQGKLMYVVRGGILDVAVDIRRGSPTFGHWAAFEISDLNHYQVYMPPGIAHGFRVLSQTADVTYKCTDYYHGGDQYGIAWNDPELEIDWGLSNPILSDRDRGWKTLENTPMDRLPER